MGGIYALASIGLTLIFGVMKIVNFAHGEFLMVAMYLSFWLFHYFKLDPYISILMEEIIINPARLIAFCLALSLAVALYFFLKLSYTGKVIRATSQDRFTALLMGSNIDRIFKLTFAIGIMLVGVAGALMIPIYTVHPFVGFEFVLVMFVVVVLGGMGSVVEATIAGIFIGIIEVFSGFLLGPESKEAIYFLVFIAVIVIKPSGLFGLEGEEELKRIEAID